MSNNAKFDAIIIGAGVGGLTAANYLAKAGARTLLVERHGIPGGYASSFRKKGHYFDAGAHYLSSLRPNGQLGRLFKDHQLEKYVAVHRADPSDTFITKDFTLEFPVDFEGQIKVLAAQFPEEASGIRKLYFYMRDTSAVDLYVELKSLTFLEFLRSYISDFRLISLLEIMLANIGVPACRASALSSVFLFREYIFDGGGYPENGIQAFPDALLNRFIDYGGTYWKGTPVSQIVLHSGKVIGIHTKKHGFVESSNVIANCDPIQLFGKLIHPNDTLDFTRYLKRANNLQPSISAFILYIATKVPVSKINPYRGCVWYCPEYKTEEWFSSWMDGSVDAKKEGFLLANSPSNHNAKLAPDGKGSLCLIIGAPPKEKEFWKENTARLTDLLLDRAEFILPGIKDAVDAIYPATPTTLHKYTLNHQGAMYGWAPIVSQVGHNVLPVLPSIDGLFVAGHWSGPPAGAGGIPMAVYSGRQVAKRVTRNMLSVIC